MQCQHGLMTMDGIGLAGGAKGATSVQKRLGNW